MDELHIVTVVKTYGNPFSRKDGSGEDIVHQFIGLIEVDNHPPSGLENPSFEQAELDEDVLFIEGGEDPNTWSGCYAFWRGQHWIISISQMLSNGEKALISLAEYRPD
jgi:hypothetical protein